MNIEQIISTTPDQEARDHIRRQYQSDLQVLGEREALEFARFRADDTAERLDALESAARSAEIEALNQYEQADYDFMRGDAEIPQNQAARDLSPPNGVKP